MLECATKRRRGAAGRVNRPCWRPERVALVTAVSFLVAATTACREQGASTAPARPPVVVQTIKVEHTEVPRLLRAVGTLESPQDTELAAEVEGPIVHLDIPEGREVERGYVLARVDDRQARAAVATARARYKNANDTLARLQTLRGKTVISQQELDDARAELEAAEGQLEGALATLEKTAIRAPFTGVLGLRRVSLGRYLKPGDPLVRLTQTAPLRLIFSVPQGDAWRLAAGQAVDGGAASCTEPLTGRVTAIDPALDTATRAVRVQATVTNENGKLRPGMAAVVRVHVDSAPDAVLVPQEAIVRQGTKRLVYTVDADGLASPREVRLGAYLADRVEVESGLEVGDEVVVAGHQKLRPGSTVASRPYEPIANPNLELGTDATRERCGL
jgi:membrane fusion protein (multidrug efflux system)